jgi:hypothetical protein
VSRAQRIAILAVAAVVLVGGFVLAQGSNDDDDTSTQAGATQQAQTATNVETAPNEAENPAATAPETTEQPPPPRVETVAIRDLKPAGEVKTLEYESGETIRLEFTSDKAAEVHIHGYDKTVDVPADGSVTERFKADAEGIFEIEEHHSGALLAKLEVQP